MDHRVTKIRDALVAFAEANGLRPDWHEPDEQGVKATLVGDHLDNAFGNYIGNDPGLNGLNQEFVVCLQIVREDDTSQDYEQSGYDINLADLLALATMPERERRAEGFDPETGLSILDDEPEPPTDVGGLFVKMADGSMRLASPSDLGIRGYRLDGEPAKDIMHPPTLMDVTVTKNPEKFEGQKIQAIKRIRGLVKIGLKEAKNLYEGMTTSLPISTIQQMEIDGWEFDDAAGMKLDKPLEGLADLEAYLKKQLEGVQGRRADLIGSVSRKV